jgi:Zn-dependent protease with chaperone function
MTSVKGSPSNLTYLQQRNQKLYEEMLQPGALRPRLTWPKVLAFALALMIHGLTLYLVWASVWHLANGFTWISRRSGPLAVGNFGIAIGTFLFAWTLRPRLGRWPEGILIRAEFPALYGLADKVATALNTAPIDGIVWASYYGASYSQVGMRQKRMISIGLPLWAILNDQERIALIAHKVAHSVNGDVTRTLILGSALKAISSWDSTARAISPLIGPVWLFSSAVLAILRRLLLHESRRAEYFADALAVEVGGTDAMLSTFRKLQFAISFRSIVTYTPAGTSAHAVFDKFRDYVAAVSVHPQTMQDLESATTIQDAHYNFTHPPLALRKNFLETRPKLEPKLTLSQDEAAALALESSAVTQTLTVSTFQGP